MIVGGAGIFGLVKAREGGIHLQTAGCVYAGLAVVRDASRRTSGWTTSPARRRSRASSSQVVRKPHTWIMAFLYIGTFGSFIGYSAAMPLLIKLNFWVPEPAPLGTGIYFAYFAFLGAGIGSLTRPFGGWLADKYGGARVTLGAFTGMVVFTLARAVDADPADPEPDRRPGDRQRQPVAGSRGSSAFFLLIFASTGIGNGSTYKMIPAIWRREAETHHRGRVRRSGPPPSPPSTKQASAALGVIGAVGALGGFLIPIAFSSPWVDDPLSATKGAFVVFTAFYVRVRRW